MDRFVQLFSPDAPGGGGQWTIVATVLRSETQLREAKQCCEAFREEGGTHVGRWILWQPSPPLEAMFCFIFPGGRCCLNMEELLRQAGIVP